MKENVVNNQQNIVVNKIDSPLTRDISSWKVLLFCILISFLFLMVCSANSFLYAFNDNQDINWYITIGNGMLNGKIPYKDLFEQKGPIVYYIFAFLCMFGNPYHNAFILEVICITLFLYFSYKIMLKFTTPFKALVGTTIVCFIYTTSPFFVVGGGAVEEYCAPIFAWFLLSFFDYTYDKKAFSYFRVIIMGVMLSILFMVKFTLIILPAIILIIWFVIQLKQREFKRTFLSVFLMLISFIFIFCLSLIYFIINDAVKDLFIVYFYDNLFLYKTELNILSNFSNIFFYGFFGMAFVILGLIVYIHKFEKKAISYTILVLSYIVLLLLSGNFSYYFQPLLVFSSLGVACSVDYVSYKYNAKQILKKLSLILTVIICFIFCFPFGNATNEMFWAKEDYIHYQIAQDIHNYGIENPSLFCYKMWDYGFYNVAGIIPTEKYFANNLFDENSFPEMYNSFYSAIEEKRNDFVLVRIENYESDKEFIDKYYKIYKTYTYRYYKNTITSYDFTVYLMVPLE